MPEETPVPGDHPLSQAWHRYIATPEYANSLRWARSTDHTEGSMWAAFQAGWAAAKNTPEHTFEETTPVKSQA